jgi:hypothetical protein
MMTELAGGLITWALPNVLFVVFFLLGSWRRERSVRVPRAPNPSAARALASRPRMRKRGEAQELESSTR